MVKTSDLKEKEVINVRDGSRLGLIYDIEIDLNRGVVEAVYIPGSSRLLSFFGRSDEYVIKWEDIIKIGKDVILVDYDINRSRIKRDSQE
ncbi:YlmC/YmxH family sporulation protein [Caloranaerobacter ferrireducens]|uniref:YlmC/YmxH family sporulation protein n=1 Tax=Caloranaerobacter ferrireducens TaxID=1323370 RepID=UPI00084D9C66|nr:YlmC/YmxH family sporulation protein [Caloranaerobacter ferrireducens]